MPDQLGPQMHKSLARAAHAHLSRPLNNPCSSWRPDQTSTTALPRASSRSTSPVVRFFNITSSFDPERHCMISAERRLSSVETLIAKQAYLELFHGVPAIFDARADADPVEDRTHFEEAITASGRKVTVLRA